METIKTRSHSFLLRIWYETAAKDVRQPHLWRAQVQHVQSGKSCYVDELPELIAFIESQTGQLTDIPALKPELS